MKKHIHLGDIKCIYFIGIGGISMSGLAEILAKDGFEVRGSDWKTSVATDRLTSVGIDVRIGCDEKNITSDIDLVVYTAAIKPENLERVAAARLGMRTIVRAELLGLMLKDYEYAVCIAGSHGKTSTTALVTAITQTAGLDPTVNIGGYINGSINYYVGNSPYFILEACEYSNSFHHFHPQIGAILNMDPDHMDFYGSMDAIIEAFAKFARNIRPSGVLIINEDIQGFDKITANLECRVVTFNTSRPSKQYWVGNIYPPSFNVMKGSDLQARVSLPLPGKYNMHNALAAFAIAQELKIKANVITTALSQIVGVKRRYEYKGEFGGAIIIDDYAHHPTEIKACLAAARDSYPDRRIICLFQPHTYTRTRDLFEEFTQAFVDADETMFVPIYAAREPFDPSISSAMLADKVGGESCDSLEDAETKLRGKLMSQDLLITMGAGDVNFVGEWLLKR